MLHDWVIGYQVLSFGLFRTIRINGWLVINILGNSGTLLSQAGSSNL